MVILVNKRLFLIVLILLFSLGFARNIAFAISETKLTASDAAAEDWFGKSVSINGDTMVVGAVYEDDKGTNSGSAYVFRYDGTSWVEEAKLTASDGAAYDQFGCSVSISGDKVVVGAQLDDDLGGDSGSAYIFRYNGTNWVEVAKLTASDGSTNSSFGNSVSVSGETVVVGAYWDDGAGWNSGSAYVFRYNGTSWVEETKLTPSDAAYEDFIGESVSISGDTIVVGAFGDDDGGNNSGSAYIFRYNGTNWVEETKLTASDASEDAIFGNRVCISGDAVVVGSYGDDDAGYLSGAAYIFRYNGSSWVEEAKLTASDGAAGNYFGVSVSITGDTAVVGAYGSDSTYIFRYKGTSWVEVAKLKASGGALRESFGASVSINGDKVVVGAPTDDDNGFWSGSAYVFNIADILVPNKAMPWIPLLLLDY
jgi:hypothetical protein